MPDSKHKPPGKIKRLQRRASERAAKMAKESLPKPALATKTREHSNTTNERPQPKSPNDNPAKDFGGFFSHKGSKSLLGSGWVQNAVVSIVFACILAVVGIIVKSPTVIIVGAACRLTVVIGSIAFLLVRSDSATDLSGEDNPTKNILDNTTTTRQDASEVKRDVKHILALM